jgi:hypothetical protein
LRLKPHITASLASPSQANRRPRVGFWWSKHVIIRVTAGLYKWGVCKGDNMKLELPDCWKGSCSGMRMRVIAEQKISMDSTPLRFLRIAGFSFDFNISLLRCSSHSCALLQVMFQCRPIHF